MSSASSVPFCQIIDWTQTNVERIEMDLRELSLAAHFSQQRSRHSQGPSLTLLEHSGQKLTFATSLQDPRSAGTPAPSNEQLTVNLRRDIQTTRRRRSVSVSFAVRLPDRQTCERLGHPVPVCSCQCLPAMIRPYGART